MSFWTSWVWDFPHLAVGAAEFAFMWWVVWAVRRGRRNAQSDVAPQHCCPECGSTNRLVTVGNCGHLWHSGVATNHRSWCRCAKCRRAHVMAVERGKPKTPMHPVDDLAALAPHTRTNRCTNCGARCRHHIHHPGWNNTLDSDVALCDTCYAQVPATERDALGVWMSYDLVRI